MEKKAMTFDEAVMDAVKKGIPVMNLKVRESIPFIKLKDMYNHDEDEDDVVPQE